MVHINCPTLGYSTTSQLQCHPNSRPNMEEQCLNKHIMKRIGVPGKTTVQGYGMLIKTYKEEKGSRIFPGQFSKNPGLIVLQTQLNAYWKWPLSHVVLYSNRDITTILLFRWHIQQWQWCTWLQHATMANVHVCVHVLRVYIIIDSTMSYDLTSYDDGLQSSQSHSKDSHRVHCFVTLT